MLLSGFVVLLIFIAIAESSEFEVFQRELDTLAELGLIARSNVGKQVFYQVNRQHPAFGELRALVTKTVGTFDVLRTALAPIAQRIALAFIYGSGAKYEERTGSDIDLMIVGAVTVEEVLEKVASAERALGRSVNPTIYSVTEFKSKLTTKSHFINSVARGPKVFLQGDEDELRRIGRG